MSKRKRLSRRQIIKRFVIPELDQGAWVAKVIITTPQNKDVVGAIISVDTDTQKVSDNLSFFSVRLIRDLLNTGLIKLYQSHVLSLNTILIYYDYIYSKRCPWHCACGKQCGGVKEHEKYDMRHQCSIHYNPKPTFNYCPATISGKHHFYRPDLGSIIKGKCSACQFDPLEGEIRCQ